MSSESKRERNKESAKQSRKRKQMYIELLEAKVARLTSELSSSKHSDSLEKSKSPANLTALSQAEMLSGIINKFMSPQSISILYQARSESGLFGSSEFSPSWRSLPVEITPVQEIELLHSQGLFKDYTDNLFQSLITLDRAIDHMSRISAEVTSSMEILFSQSLLSHQASLVSDWCAASSCEASDSLVTEALVLSKN